MLHFPPTASFSEIEYKYTLAVCLCCLSLRGPKAVGLLDLLTPSIEAVFALSLPPPWRCGPCEKA